MQSIVDDLETGALGFRWRIPDELERIGQQARFIGLRDPKRRVSWMVRSLPFRFDLQPANEDDLRADLEADARHVFDASFDSEAKTPWSPTAPRRRTEDPDWSPIVEVARTPIKGGMSVRVVRRVTYQPTNEIVSGALIVPHAEGHVEIAALAKAGMTGFRESALMLADDKAGGAMKRLSQAQFDDPKHDAAFRDHPLSIVRAALGWLIDEAGIEVTAPDKKPPKGERVVKAANCAVTLPPRYRFVPRSIMPMAPTLASYVRGGIPEAPLRLLDVWRLEEKIVGRDRARALKKLAVETTDAWASEGATGIEQEVEIVAGDGSVAVQSFVRFQAGGAPKLSAMRWRVDEDGTVFRVSTSGGPQMSHDDLIERAASVMGSLRRLD